MSSITTSEEILSVCDLELVFRLRHYQQRTVRGLFVNAISNPIDAFLKPKNSLHLLKGINFTLKKGDRLGILGVNGSGKTSLCRCIAGMLTPTAGEIRMSGSCRAIFDTQVGVIPELTGRENARLLATFLFPESPSSELEELVREGMDFSELDSFLDTPFETYSLGMKARLFLSVITAKPAKLLILDEVYDNTDRFFQMKMSARIDKLIHGADAFIFVSHSPELLTRLCNRAIVLQDARIAYDGPVDRALAAYDFMNGVRPE